MSRKKFSSCNELAPHRAWVMDEGKQTCGFLRVVHEVRVQTYVELRLYNFGCTFCATGLAT